MKQSTSKKFRNDRGFSFIELIIVILIMAIMSVLAVLAFRNDAMYEADKQALLILDVLKEAREKAINQRETMRVEIGRNDRTVRIIDENDPGNSADDVIIRSVPLASVGDIVFDAVPKNIKNNPTESTPVPALSFQKKVHPLSTSNRVATIRFQLNGNITDAGTDATATGATVKGATIYVWKPKINPDKSVSNQGEIIRAITILGASGNTRFWKCPVIDDTCAAWSK